MAHIRTQPTVTLEPAARDSLITTALGTSSRPDDLAISSIEPTSKRLSHKANDLRHKNRPEPRSRRGGNVRPTSMANLNFDQVGLFWQDDDEACPSPVIRRSQDQIDLHQALRSRLPPFKQSRRWAKVYMADNGSPTANPATHGPKGQETLDVDAECSINAACAPTFDDKSDTELDRAGPCRLAPMIGWQAFKQQRLIKRHSMPIKAARITGRGSPKRTKSTRSLRAGFNLSPRRAALPRAVQNRGKSRDVDQDDIFGSPTYQKRKKITIEALNTQEISLMRERQDDVADRATSPIPSLHDPEKDNRFSRECIGMLSGLDFGDEWRLSTFEPQLSNVSPLPSLELGLREHDDASDKLCSTPGIAVTAATPQPTRKPPQPPVRTSSKRLGVPSVARQLQFTKPTSYPMAKLVQNVRSSRTQDVDDESDDFAPLLSSVDRVESTKAANSRQKKKKSSAKDLKSARSVDTLTRIEAQVPGADSDTMSHHLQAIATPFMPSSSTANLHTPSGQPPERPLPDLPNDDRHLRRYPSRKGSQQSIMTTKMMAEAECSLEMSPIHTLISVPIYKDLDAKNSRAATVIGKTTCNTPSGSVLGFSERTSEQHSNPTQDYERARSSRRTPSNAALMVKEVTNERISRIQALKKKHLAAWNRSQEHLVVPQDDLESGHSLLVANSARDINYKSPEPSCINELDQFPCVPRSSGSQSKPSTDVQSGQELDRKLSKRNSRSRQRLHKSGLSEASSPSYSSREKSKRNSKPKQVLGHSHIMVVVDTNPHTSSFRAGAISPCPSMTSLRGRPTSPYDMSNINLPRSRPSSPVELLHAPKASLENIAELIEVVKPPTSKLSKRKSGRRSLRSQASAARNSATYPNRQGLDRVSNALPSARESTTTTCYYQMLDSTDSEVEEEPKSWAMQNQVVTPKSHDANRLSSQQCHRRKDTPFTAMLKYEVRKADQELEHLKKHERRIENLQTHLEQTLRIWGRMSQSGKKQYLASALDRIDSRKGSEGTHDAKHASIAASSVYSQPSAAGHIESGHKSFDTILTVSQRDSSELRRISGTSTMTYAGTVTDTDVSAEAHLDDAYKRGSGGSLTDPCDYDLSSSRELENEIDESSKDFRHRMGVALSPYTPHEQSGTNKTGFDGSNKHPRRRKNLSPPIVSQDQFALIQDRAMIVPWEKHDDMNAGSFDDTEAEDDSHPYRLSLDQEITGTDQMDALLVM